MGGDMLFQATARVRVPAALSEDSLRDAVEALAGALMVDITLREDENWHDEATLVGPRP
jgi:glycine cleavage system regulatory protein